jgi:cobalt-zinc-cadmium efflux system membrane fusion protein
MPVESWWRRILPNALVLAAIIGVAWLGHHTEWTFGLRSKHTRDTERTGAGQAVTLQTASSAFGSSDLCSPHGVFDCPHCYPDRAQVDPVPEITVEEVDRVQAALALRPRSEVPQPATELARVVRFDSADAVDKAGIDVAPVSRETITETLAASGELQFDPAYLARIPARVAGSAWRVYKQTGSPVRSGEILALVDSATIGSSKAELQQALVQVGLKKHAHKNIQGAPVAERQVREAKAELQEAENRLLNAEQSLVNFGLEVKAMELLGLPADSVSRRLQVLGLSQSVVDEPDHSVPASLLPVRAAFDGVVLDANVIAGEVVERQQVLFTVVDPRQMWISLAVPAADVGLIRLGQEVRFRPDGSSRTVSGQIAWIGSTADERTRTIPVRINVANSDGALRAYSLGQGEIILRVDPSAIVVPTEAVRKIGDTTFVFVRNKGYFHADAPKEFHLRAVRLGVTAGDIVEVLAGVFPGEVVATKGSNLLLNEVTKNQATRLASARRARKSPVVTARSLTKDSETERN